MEIHYVEVGLEPFELAVMAGGLPFVPERHELLPDGEWLSHLKRRTGMDNLLMYRHREVGSFVVAGWVVPPKEPCGRGGVVIELEGMSGPPDQYPRDLPDMQFMVLRTSPVGDQAAAMKKKMGQRREEQRAKRLASLTRQRDVAEHFRRQGREDLGALIVGQGYVGPEEGGEQFDAWQSFLNDRAAGRTVCTVPTR